MSQRGFLVVVLLGFAHASSACGSSVEPNEEPAAGASVTAGGGGAGLEAGAAGETAAAGAGQGGTSGNVNAAGSSSGPAGDAGQTGNAGQAGAPTWDQFLEQDYCRRACTEEMALPCYAGKTTLAGCQDDCVQRWLGLYLRCPDEAVALTHCAGEPAGFTHACVEATVVETYSLSCGDQVTAVSTCGAGM
jgi:hypothetical protein